jgi:hypothetical protein
MVFPGAQTREVQLASRCVKSTLFCRFEAVKKGEYQCSSLQGSVRFQRRSIPKI